MADIEKISREDFTNAVKVAEEKVDKELKKIKKSLDKKKITSREYVNKTNGGIERVCRYEKGITRHD